MPRLWRVESWEICHEPGIFVNGFFQYKTGSVPKGRSPVFLQSCVFAPQPLSSALQPPPREGRLFLSPLPLLASPARVWLYRGVDNDLLVWIVPVDIRLGTEIRMGTAGTSCFAGDLNWNPAGTNQKNLNLRLAIVDQFGPGFEVLVCTFGWIPHTHTHTVTHTRTHIRSPSLWQWYSMFVCACVCVFMHILYGRHAYIHTYIHTHARALHR